MNKHNLLISLAIGALFAGIGVAVGVATRHPAPAAPAAAAAPGTPSAALFAMTLDDSKGAKHALAQWKGKPLLVNFWAPWCAPCVEEMPELDALARVQRAKGLQVIGIGIDSPSNIAEFSQKLKISYPLYVSGMGGTDLARQFGNTAGGLPYTVLIGADGQVKKTYLGRLKFEQLKADLATL